MKPEELLIAFTDLEDDIVLDAREPLSKGRGRRLSLLPAAAMVAMMLIGCAYAVFSEADWFKNFFEEKTEQALSEEQAAYVDEHTQQIAQSVTVDGYTITVESAIADKYDAYIKLTFRAPEGVVLDAESYLDAIPLDENGAPILPFARADGKTISYHGTLSPIEDGNLTDNVHGILYNLHLNPDYGFSFDDGSVWTLDFHDMTAYYDDGRETVVAKGLWHFDIVFERISTHEIEFLTERQPYTVTIYENGDPTCQDVTITSVKLRTMTGELTFEGLQDAFRAAGFAALPVVMKDGSSVEMCMNSAGNGQLKYSLSAPILLEEVDHILLPDGTKLMMPQ